MSKPPKVVVVSYISNRKLSITSAPEHFQQRMSEILSGLPGTLCLIDDTLMFVEDKQEHDNRLHAALERLRVSGLTLNKEKCRFSQSRVTFLGQVLDAGGVHLDPKKVRAIVEMKEPTDRTELRRFLGMTNQLGKFPSKSFEITKPLRELLSLKNEWHWGPSQDKAFNDLKIELSDPRKTFAHYDPGAETVVSADASSFGLVQV